MVPEREEEPVHALFIVVKESERSLADVPVLVKLVLNVENSSAKIVSLSDARLTPSVRNWLPNWRNE